MSPCARWIANPYDIRFGGSSRALYFHPSGGTLRACGVISRSTALLALIPIWRCPGEPSAPVLQCPLYVRSVSGSSPLATRDRTVIKPGRPPFPRHRQFGPLFEYDRPRNCPIRTTCHSRASPESHRAARSRGARRPTWRPWRLRAALAWPEPGQNAERPRPAESRGRGRRRDTFATESRGEPTRQVLAARTGAEPT
jgi:hypothetical protein